MEKAKHPGTATCRVRVDLGDHGVLKRLLARRLPPKSAPGAGLGGGGEGVLTWSEWTSMASFRRSGEKDGNARSGLEVVTTRGLRERWRWGAAC